MSTISKFFEAIKSVFGHKTQSPVEPVDGIPSGEADTLLYQSKTVIGVVTVPHMPTVKFDPSLVTEAVKAEIRKNVELIEGVDPKDFDQVYELVVRSVESGRDLGGLCMQLEKQFGMTKAKAIEISRSLHNKATTVINRGQQQDLGITEAIWAYSGAPCAPKKPTPQEAEQDAAHKAANGKKFNINEGMYLNGKWTWPGHEKNCRCTQRSIFPSLGRAVQPSNVKVDLRDYPSPFRGKR